MHDAGQKALVFKILKKDKNVEKRQNITYGKQKCSRGKHTFKWNIYDGHFIKANFHMQNANFS